MGSLEFRVYNVLSAGCCVLSAIMLSVICGVRKNDEHLKSVLFVVCQTKSLQTMSLPNHPTSQHNMGFLFFAVVDIREINLFAYMINRPRVAATCLFTRLEESRLL